MDLHEFAESPMTTAKTAAQRQADRKARELAAGRVQWKRWVHHDDVPAMAQYADKLARERARSEKAVQLEVDTKTNDANTL